MDGWLGIVEVDGECADEAGEIWSDGEEVDDGKIACVCRKGKVSVEQACGTRVEGGAGEGGGGEGLRMRREGRQDGVEELCGESSEGH